MKSIAKTLFAITTLALAAQVSAQVTLYENEGFQGRSFTTQERVGNFQRAGFNDLASSAVVAAGQRWEACENSHLQGRCLVLRPGRYPSLSAMGLNDRISSIRPLENDERVADSSYAPMPVAVVAQDFNRRRNERLYDAPVKSARAVVGTPGQRCWMEREQVVQQQQQQPVQQQGGANVPAALLGAVVGGILGHQVGGGTGKDIATVGGVVGGAALGAQYGRNNNSTAVAQPVVSTQDVRRCDSNPVQATPSYWDVVYDFRGQEHRVQMATQPGRTVTVNRQGEPRV